jgi:hypothetical protein
MTDTEVKMIKEECWVAEPSSAEIDPPVAWCEIPKYNE